MVGVDDHREHNTAAGRRQGCPEKEAAIRWVREAWASIPPAMVSKAFCMTGIANALDGTEDEAIYEEEWDIIIPDAGDFIYLFTYFIYI